VSRAIAAEHFAAIAKKSAVEDSFALGEAAWVKSASRFFDQHVRQAKRFRRPILGHKARPTHGDGNSDQDKETETDADTKNDVYKHNSVPLSEHVHSALLRLGVFTQFAASLSGDSSVRIQQLCFPIMIVRFLILGVRLPCALAFTGGGGPFRSDAYTPGDHPHHRRPCGARAFQELQMNSSI
jgi:hypothetical protein